MLHARTFCRICLVSSCLVSLNVSFASIFQGSISQGSISQGLALSKAVVPYGHFEDSSEKELSELFGKVTVPAEYEPVRGVMLSRELFRYQEENYLKDLLNSSLEEVWYLVPSKNSQNYSQTIAEIEKEAGEFKSKLRFFENNQKSQIQTIQTLGNYTVWARDWAPFFGKFNQSKDENSTLAFMDFNYYVSRPSDDSSGRALARSIQENSNAPIQNKVVRGSVPLYLEGGNFMTTTSGVCAVTKKIVAANSQKDVPEDIVFNESEVVQLLKDSLGCKKVILPNRMPSEQTGHIDMWAKFLSDTDVIIGEIDEIALAKVGQKLNTSDKKLNEQIKDFLDTQAELFAASGFKVTRIPMPLAYEGVFRSYTNSLLANKIAFVPKYERDYYGSYRDAEYLAGYEDSVRKIYQDLGYEVRFLKSDKLIADGGAIHCTSMQVPK